MAIVDFDIHHGNGTEACVEAVVPTPWSVTHETPAGSVSASGVTYKPWLGAQDSENIFFSSIHGYGADAPTDADESAAVSVFYPGSGGPNETQTDVAKGPVVRNVPVRLRTRSAAWRREMMTKVLVPLREFAPDLVVISAGFDAHAHDALEAGGLHDRDYEWMTSELVRIAEACAHGRLVSVLEGGYQVAGGFSSSLARAVGSHVATLDQPSLVGATWEADEASKRLEAAISYEDTWLINRAVAQAKVGESSGAAPAAPEQDNGAPARRSRRARGTVDYGTLEAEIQREEGGEEGGATTTVGDAPKSDGEAPTNGGEALSGATSGEAPSNDGNGGEAASNGGEALPAPEQESGAAGRRSKRARGAVDYSALDAQLQKEEAEGSVPKKPKSESL